MLLRNRKHYLAQLKRLALGNPSGDRFASQTHKQPGHWQLLTDFVHRWVPFQQLHLEPSRFNKTYFNKTHFKRRRKGENQAAVNRLGLWSGLVVAVVSVGFSGLGAWDVLEQQSYNLLHQARREFDNAPVWDERVVVIAIDQNSIEQLGRFPWPRYIHAELLDRLQKAQPSAIAFDVLFPDITEEDGQLAEAIVANANNIVLAVGSDAASGYLNVASSIAEPAQGFFLKGDIGNQPDSDGISRRIPPHNERFPSFSEATLQVYAQNMGATAPAQLDFLSRQILANEPEMTLAHRTNRLSNSPSPLNTPSSSPLNTASKSQPQARKPHSPSVYQPKASDGSAQAQAQTQPQTQARSEHDSMASTQAWLAQLMPRDEPLWVNWPGEVKASHQPLMDGDLPIYSYADVINNQIDPSIFHNKIVLVGATYAGADPLRTPFHQASPVNGVHLHAAIINNLLAQSFLRRLPVWQGIVLTVLLATVGSHLLRHQGAYRRLAMVICFPVAWGAIAYGAFVMGWWIPVAAPMGTVFLSALAIQLHEQQEQQQLMELFSMNVSAGTADLIWRHKGAILHRGELAAQTLTATVLFMDIRGFTSIAETLPSQQLLPWLNQYFETMTDCIMNHGGMVDKYIGDSIMAVFGAPLPRLQPDEIKADAIAAVSAAIEMHSRLQSLNQQLRTQNLPPIEFGIGIHTGPLIGGTVGNRHRLNYSLFGDTVNVAARLEAMTKSLPPKAPFKLLISADTYEYTHECSELNLPFELFKSTQLRGRESHTDVYALALAKLTPAVSPVAAPAAMVTTSSLTSSLLTSSLTS
ncbi:MAG: adenylate/guanylate cyclase domain-containing protein [Phormidesmis sp. RL_2_1]|nr:adenylate/guanylate cyclase domain-containing protein [Phormidesmis sp. RL_2_1]